MTDCTSLPQPIPHALSAKEHVSKPGLAEMSDKQPYFKQLRVKTTFTFHSNASHPGPYHSTGRYVPQSKAAILLPKLAADDLTELVELD